MSQQLNLACGAFSSDPERITTTTLATVVATPSSLTTSIQLNAVFERSVGGSTVEPQIKRSRIQKHFHKRDEKKLVEANRSQIFISYSHKDEEWRRLIENMLHPLLQRADFSSWSDTKIQSGADWQRELYSELKRSRIVIPLVSSDYLASNFITEKELPWIRAEHRKGLKIMPVIVRPTMYSDCELSDFQAANSPDRPLSKLHGAVREQAVLQLCEKIRDAYFEED